MPKTELKPYNNDIPFDKYSIKQVILYALLNSDRPMNKTDVRSLFHRASGLTKNSASIYQELKNLSKVNILESKDVGTFSINDEKIDMVDEIMASEPRRGPRLGSTNNTEKVRGDINVVLGKVQFADGNAYNYRYKTLVDKNKTFELVGEYKSRERDGRNGFVTIRVKNPFGKGHLRETIYVTDEFTYVVSPVM